MAILDMVITEHKNTKRTLKLDCASRHSLHLSMKISLKVNFSRCIMAAIPTAISNAIFLLLSRYVKLQKR